MKPNTPKSAHTPGPWVLTNRNKNESIGVRSSDGEFLAEVFDFNEWARDTEQEANARLIAAAPDMFSLLRLQDGYAEGETWALEEIRDAITDNEGRDFSNAEGFFRFHRRAALAKAVGGH